ncbi:hypothetical protein ES703_11785 [subsurface metagenome]
MTDFFFLDSNIIFGYCNPSDRLFPVIKPFYNTIKNENNIFLLLSVEKEFYRKIRNIFDFFQRKVSRYLRGGKKPQISKIKSTILDAPGNTMYFFERFIFDLFDKKGITQLSYGNMMKVLIDFNNSMRGCFKTFTNHWIKRPSANDYQTVIDDTIFSNYREIIGDLLHFPDNLHLALAAYYVTIRNLKNDSHNYVFYTDDRQFIYNNLEQVINIANLKIKKINYKKKSQLHYNPSSKSFDIPNDVLEFIPDKL